MYSFITKYRDFIFLTIGTLLVLISLFLLSYDKIVLLKSNIFDEIEMQINKENSYDQNELLQGIDEDLIINNLSINDVNEDATSNIVSKNNIKREYIGYLEINKINLKNGLVSKNSFYNNVDYNIQTIKESDYPDVSMGNLILAAHSGTSSISYFKNLYRLELGDEAKIYYKDYVYTYKIVNIYNTPKNGHVAIKRDTSKNCLTLITCTKGSDTEQTVYILEMISSFKEGD